jgi:RNA polymerase sigma factor (sigma-70 family)
MSVGERSDRELVERARRGDKLAFGALVERHQGAARGIALRMVPYPEVVKDLVQEALLEAYLSLGRLRKADRFRSWLCGIVLNLCRNYWRETQRRVSRLIGMPEEGSPEWWQLQSRLPGPEEIAEARELHHKVLEAIDGLPPTQREATLLFYYESLSLKEIAAVAGISVGAVKVRLYRARQQLRKQIVESQPEIQPVVSTQARRIEMIKVQIADVIKLNRKTGVLLLDEEGTRALPIWIGEFEAASIAMGVKDFSTPRPMTYHFIANLLEALGGKLEEVRVEALKGYTFYGVAKVRLGDKSVEIDARPSDVLALAAQTGSPIYMAEEVMEQEGRSIREGLEMPENLRGVDEIPLPTGEGMDMILKEMEAIMHRGQEEFAKEPEDMD